MREASSAVIILSWNHTSLLLRSSRGTAQSSSAQHARHSTARRFQSEHHGASGCCVGRMNAKGRACMQPCIAREHEQPPAGTLAGATFSGATGSRDICSR